jgi:hypothetical protein
MRRVKAEKHKAQLAAFNLLRPKVLRWPPGQTCEALARLRALRAEQRSAGVIDLRAELMGDGNDYSAV